MEQEVQKVLIGNFKGPQGEPGKTGDQGQKGEMGVRGSKHFDGTGITGTSTTPTVFSGSGVTEAMIDDWYLNTDTGNLYRCTTAGSTTMATWVYIGNLKGPQGDPASEEVMKKKLNTDGDASNTTVVFSEASELENIATGEKMSTIFGKVAKAIKGFIEHFNLKGTTSVAGHLKLGDTSETACAGNDSRLSDARTPKEHDHAASDIKAGTLAGKVNANASAMATLTNAQLRDIVVLESDPGEGATVSYNPGTIVGTK